MGGEHDECYRLDAWESQKERNLRYERTFEKIENHLERQTNVMVQIASQGEKIDYILKRQEEDRETHKILFSQVKEQREALAAHKLSEGTDAKDSIMSVKNGVVLIIISTVISLLVKAL